MRNFIIDNSFAMRYLHFMKLDAYLTATGTTYESFGERIGRSKSQIGKYCEGTHMPRPDVLKRIVKETKGKVTHASFYQDQ